MGARPPGTLAAALAELEAALEAATGRQVKLGVEVECKTDQVRRSAHLTNLKREGDDNTI